MSKANKLASLAVDVNNLSELADQVTDIENAIVRANTNAQVIEGIADDIEALEANTADIMNDFASISNVFNSGITYSTDGENEYYDANSVTNTVATVDIIEMNIQNPQDGELLSYSTSANTWVNSPAPVIPEMPEIPEIPEQIHLNNRNKIINGAMEIDQRLLGIRSFQNSPAYAIDRWCGRRQGAWSTYSATLGRSTDAPAGFRYSLEYTSVGTEPNPGGATNDVKCASGFGQYVEFVDPTETYTLSFWVKSTIAGIYTVSIDSFAYEYGVGTNYDQHRIMTIPYTIQQANTWEYITIQVPGDSSLTRAKYPKFGLMHFLWTMATDKDMITTINQWDIYSSIERPHWSSVENNVSFNKEPAGQKYNITGVQLEAGSIASNFEHRSFTSELISCKRFYQKSCDYHVSVENIRTTDSNWDKGVQSYQPLGGGYGTHKDIRFTVSMRTNPTIYIYSPGTGAAKVWNNSLSADLGYTYIYGNSNEGFYINAGGDNSSNGTHCYFHWKAENDY